MSGETYISTGSQLEALQTDLSATELLLQDHNIQNFAEVHGTIQGQVQDYRDSNGDLAGTRVLKIQIGGQIVYVPCTIFP